jgi:hypothetical protein
VEHGRLVVVAVGSEPPVARVIYHGDKALPTDGGFTVLFSDAPQDELPEPDELKTLCLHCLIEENPEAGTRPRPGKRTWGGTATRKPASG